DHVGLNALAGVADVLLGQAAFEEERLQGAEPFAVDAELRDGRDELALFLAQVLAPDHREELALPDAVAVVERPRRLRRGCADVAFRALALDSRADLLDLADEQRVDAKVVVSVVAERAVQPQLPGLGRTAEEAAERVPLRSLGRHGLDADG